MELIHAFLSNGDCIPFLIYKRYKEFVALYVPHYRGVAQFGLERFIWDEEVAGSNPATPTSLVIGESL